MPYGLANQKVLLQRTGRRLGTGWLPPMVDVRDYTIRHKDLAPLMKVLEKQLAAHKMAKALKAPPAAVDLRQWCSPIEDQQQLGSCTAHAAIGIVEYFERKAFGKHIDGSRLFIYKATRNLIGVTGDTGAWLRNAMGALVMCGVPPEQYWPYTDDAVQFDVEPPPFVYAVADNFEATKYFAHDPLSKNVPPPTVISTVKMLLAAGIPAMFGFFGYASFESGDQPGHIPLPADEEIQGDPAFGHAIVAVGYDDARKIINTATNKSTKGAFLIRNSWGIGWGDNGYGWIPYDYVMKGVALDFWSLLNLEWVAADQFYE